MKSHELKAQVKLTESKANIKSIKKINVETYNWVEKYVRNMNRQSTEGKLQISCKYKKTFFIPVVMRNTN